MFNKANQAMYLYFFCKYDASEYIHRHAKKMTTFGKEVQFVFEDDSGVRCVIENDEIADMSLLR